MSLQPDHAASVEFLRAFHPAGPWVLTFIDVERRGIRTDTFGLGTSPGSRRRCTSTATGTSTSTSTPPSGR